MSAVVGPRRADPFLNQADARRKLRKALYQTRAQRRPCLIFVHGPEGIGRSSLTSEFFYENAEEFGGNCLDIVARETNGQLVPSAELARQLLTELGLPAAELPDSEAARYASVQRLLARHRGMIRIKDVVTAEQVAGLIPQSASEVAVVLTTRTMLRGLRVEHEFTDIPLMKLQQAETRELLAHRLGATAREIPAETLHGLADFCDGVPWLVRVLAAHLAGRHRIAERVLADLRSSERALLGMDESQRIARFLDMAYESLGRSQVTYRMLALLPGPSFSADTAAAALGSGIVRVEWLDDLVDKNLLIYDDESGRYSFHNRLVREDALRREYEVDGADGCRPWLYRIASWYLKEAVPRDVALGRRWRVGLAFEEYAASNAPLPSRADALTWWRAEWASGVDCVELAHRNGLHDIAWQLCVALFKYLHMNGHYDPWLRTHDLGVESAKAAGDDSGLMQVLNQRGAVRLALGAFDAARGDFSRSHELALQVGHLAGEQSALEWLGKIVARAGDRPKAMDYYDKSQEVVERAGAALGDEQPARMVALLDLQRGRAWIEEASCDQAAAVAERAEAYFASAGESENQAKALLVLGDAAMGRGDVAGAVERYGRAVALFDEDGALRSSANARRSLGKALVVADRKADAIAVYLHAQETFERLFDDAADELARTVAELRA